MSDRRKQQWPMQGEGYCPFNPTPVKARPRKKATEDLSYHLMMLQQRNRLLKKLSQKGEKEVELERKEQGFSLYLNGANTAPPPPPHRRLQSQSAATQQQLPSQNRASGTAGGGSGRESPDRDERSKTAPSKKSWNHDTVVVKTQDGQTLPVTAPGIISGCYDDDFESSAAEMSDDENIKEGWCEGGGEGGGGEGSEQEESTEVEELADSFLELSQQCSSLQNTLASGSQDSLGLCAGETETKEEREEEKRDEVEVEEVEVKEKEVSDELSDPATTTLAVITERVRRLDHRGQRKLLEMLDTLSSGPTSTPDWLQTQSKPPPPPPLSSSPVAGADRPVSTRSTGLRGEMARRSTISATDESSLWREHSTADGMVNSHRRPYRSGSGRTSGIRGQLLSRAHSDHAIGAAGRETWTRGRQTGVRGDLQPPGHTSSEPDLICPQSRPHTVVMEPGHRPIRMESGPIMSHSYCEGEIIDPQPLPLLTDEPFDPAHWPHPSPDLNKSLASVSFFDHTHQGQLGRTTPGDGLLETFLTEYQQMKMETPDPHSPQNEATPSPTSLHLEKEVEEEEERGKDEEGDSGYSTPELPTGQQLVLNLLTTWGDQFYIGLTGLEIFTASGERASITEISADPADINVLPEYSGDPRVVANLLDGVNHTKDDLHMWLAPFTPSQPHIITISFSSPTSLAMIRVWNYNKSRIHSYRGVRDMEMWLDEQLIFRGEIRRASGGILNRSGNSGETILFTTDGEILFRVSLHDNHFQEEMSCDRSSCQKDEDEDEDEDVDVEEDEEKWEEGTEALHKQMFTSSANYCAFSSF